ncbi:Stress regulated protein [Melia azedarach]|uniref:Stress regulated protein n=1 Tax=Melia azedarach TaxID=155640 RepID=A0ACC1Y8E6_MELAZ|nr:Stress regulated protein [Melia azedarach]
MYSAISWQVGRELVASGKEAEFAIRRRRALKRVDKELSRGNFKTALSLVKQLQRNPAGGLRGFGAVKQVPKRVTSLNELELDSKELLPLQSLLASVMESIERCNFFDSFDEAASDRVESLTEDESYGSLNEKDHSMCMQHEAGHFLVGYLLGVLPKGYNVPSIEALRQEESAVGSVQFIGFEFLKEIALARRLRRTYTAQGDGRTKRHTISSKTLSNFSCVILGGLVAEHIAFGHSEGHYADIDKLEYLFRWLGYKRSEVDSRVQWAALNTVLISFQHIEVRSRLAEAMSLGRSVGFCIDTIESALYGREM